MSLLSALCEQLRSQKSSMGNIIPDAYELLEEIPSDAKEAKEFVLETLFMKNIHLIGILGKLILKDYIDCMNKFAKSTELRKPDRDMLCNLLLMHFSHELSIVIYDDKDEFIASYGNRYASCSVELKMTEDSQYVPYTENQE